MRSHNEWIVSAESDRAVESNSGPISGLNRRNVTVLRQARAVITALDELRDDLYRLTRKTPLRRALRALVGALAIGGNAPVERPPRPQRRPSRWPRPSR